jgi:hypothetical protein
MTRTIYYCLTPFALLQQSAIDWWFINQRNLSLTVLEAAKSKIRVLKYLVCVKGSLYIDGAFLFYLHMEKELRC